MLEKTFKPIVKFFDKLTFKHKLILSISTLLMFLVVPTTTVFHDLYKQNKIYIQEKIGIEYIKRLHKLSLMLQLHRGLLNTYLNGGEILKQKIVKNEKEISNILYNFVNYDKNNLNYLSHDKSFIDVLVKFEMLKLENIQPIYQTSKLFKMHTSIIKDIYRIASKIASKTDFTNNTDEKIKYMANLLVNKMFILEDSIGQIRGISSAVFEKKQITQEEKNTLLALYTIVKSIQNDLKENKVIITLDNFQNIQTIFLNSLYKINNLLTIINDRLFMQSNFDYNGKSFFILSSKTLDEVSNLFDIILNKFDNSITKQYNAMKKDLLYLITGVLLIALLSTYLFTALFKSITNSLKKLQYASKLISEGKTDIKLSVDTKDEIGEAISAFNDMSEKLRENISFLDIYKMAIDETSIVSKTDPRGVITYVNKKFCESSGYTPDELVGMPHNIVRHPDMPKEAFRQMWHTIKKEKKIWKGIVKNKRKDGGHYIVDATIIPVVNDGEIVEYIAVRHDVTELEDSKEEIKRQKIDLLTSLPNRTALLEDIKKVVSPTLFLFDIDQFTSLNDFYGSAMGDKVLIFIKEHLKIVESNINSKLYRVDGDKFAILIKDSRVTKQNYTDVVKNIIEYIESEAMKCDTSKCVSITLRAGIIFYEDSHNNLENLLSYANLASKYAKENNKKFQLYTESMNQEKNYQKNIEWINKIKSAIKEDRIVTFFQPIVDNKIEAITKYETLMRMIDENGKVVSPFFFLDIAKKAKLYNDLTKIIIDKALKTFANYPQYEFSINLSIDDIKNEDIYNFILNRVKNFPHPHKIVFEIVESEAIDSYEKINTFINEVKRYGVKIAIDDFGSGYANFEHIVKLQADFIKIDGSLIKDIATDKNSLIVTEAIIAFSKKLGTKTIVEYVHDATVYQIVKKLGADFSQGFYLGEPKKSLVGMTFKNIA